MEPSGIVTGTGSGGTREKNLKAGYALKENCYYHY